MVTSPSATWISKKQYCSLGTVKNIYDVPDIRAKKISVKRPFHVKFDSLFFLKSVKIMKAAITSTKV